ncbi:DUF4270 family protein [Dyadobacter luticola]|uniref:DUF4270 domain-containing protein n=1 Tax=Dyadobacter luticola TaxID=1979387 RepID=A0A5R9L262_9BACT|nr:DUF4270 family protein [Dyadobacter luticola]TLV02360.1 DUF4270 domain-containing protein [Dyadobacter luticola]
MKFCLFSSKKSSIVYKFLCIIGFSFSLVGCQWGDQVESLVQPDPDDFGVLFSDTATVQLSTILTDSVMTGAPRRLLVGRYIDPYFGKVQTATFIQPTIQSGLTIPQNAEYDSLVLFMSYDKYSYGDTTKAINLSVHRLLVDILTKDAYYNTNTTAFDPVAIGKKKLTPMPKRDKTFTIKLSDDLGKSIFEKGKTNLLPSNQDWINMVAGLTIRGAETDNGAVVGFKLDSARIQMHYHVPGADAVRRDSTVFQATASYNQILADRSGTEIANLIPNQRRSLPTAQTGNKAFVQAGPGIMTKIQLPTIRQLRNIQYTAANKAFLRITPTRLSVTSQFMAPPQLRLFRVNANNEFYVGGDGFPLSVTRLSDGKPVVSSLINDIVNNKQYYLLDITSYVAELLTSETDDSGALVLRTSPFNDVANENENPRASTVYPAANTEFTRSLNRLVFGDQKSNDPGIKLELYYTNVKVE